MLCRGWFQHYFLFLALSMCKSDRFFYLYQYCLLFLVWSSSVNKISTALAHKRTNIISIECWKNIQIGKKACLTFILQNLLKRVKCEEGIWTPSTLVI